jgi:hypothetical protein
VILRTVTACILAAAIAFGCSGRSDTPLDDAIIEYQGGEKSSTGKIGLGLLEESSETRFRSVDITSNGECLLSRNNGQIKIIDPETLNDILAVPAETVWACSAAMKIVTGSGQHIGVYSKNGDLLREIVIEDARDRIKAITIHDGMIYYYKGHQLFSQDMEGDPPILVVKEKFSPPNTKYYQGSLACSGSVLGIVTGGAGSYYISAVNLKTAGTVASKISSSSSKAAFTADSVYYVNGGAGDWKLYRFVFESKTKKEIRKFREINSIEIVSRGFMFSDSEGLWVQDYNGNITKVPFDFKIAGKLGDNVLLSWSGKTYRVDIDRFMSKVEQLRINVPGIFE